MSDTILIEPDYAETTIECMLCGTKIDNIGGVFQYDTENKENMKVCKDCIQAVFNIKIDYDTTNIPF